MINENVLIWLRLWCVRGVRKNVGMTVTCSEIQAQRCLRNKFLKIATVHQVTRKSRFTLVTRHLMAKKISKDKWNWMKSENRNWQDNILLASCSEQKGHLFLCQRCLTASTLSLVHLLHTSLSCFVPVLLTFFAQPRKLWSSVFRDRQKDPGEEILSIDRTCDLELSFFSFFLFFFSFFGHVLFYFLVQLTAVLW